MEDTAIREGFAHLKDGAEYQNLYEAAVCRAKADWLIGMNATRAFTTKYFKRLVVGRVQTPTLAMLVKRGEQISHFQKEKYYNLHLDCDGLEVVKEKLFDAGEAQRIKEACEGGTATVESCSSAEKAVHPPKLYDLTTLQRESNRYFGYTAKETLDFTQSLYEKKLVTYPRTDSQYLTEDMEQTTRHAIAMACEIYGFSQVYPQEPDVKRTMDNSKVSDHHAIIPTAELKDCNRQELSKGERDILQLISVRLLCAGAQKHVFQETEVRVSCAGETFLAKGKAVQEMGWKAVEAAFRERLGTKNRKAGEERTILAVTEGQTFHPVTASISEHYTTPPKPYSDVIFCERKEWIGIEERSSA